MPHCIKGRKGNGFPRKYRLVKHLTNHNANRGATSGHGVALADAERLAHEADVNAKMQRQGGTVGTAGKEGKEGTEEFWNNDAGLDFDGFDGTFGMDTPFSDILGDTNMW